MTASAERHAKRAAADVTTGDVTTGDVTTGDVTTGELALDSHELEQVVLRLRRAQGQLGAVATMLEERRGCREVVHQLAAVKRAIDRSGFVLLEAAVRQCVTSPGATSDDLKAMEKLFLALS